MKHKYLSNKYALWGIGSIGEGLVATISSTYLTFFMTDIAHIPLQIVTIAMLTMSISDFISAFSSGAIILMLPSGHWGRLRTYLLICPIIAALFYTLHFIAFSSSPIITALSISICYILARITYNLAFTANLSLLNVISKTPQEKTQLSAQRMIGSNLGRMLSNTLPPILITFLATYFSENTVYAMITSIFGIFYVFFNLVHFKISNGCEQSIQYISEQKKFHLREILTTLFNNTQLFITLLIDLTSNITSIVLPALAVYYYSYVFERPDLISTHMFLIGIAAIAGSATIHLFGKRIQSDRSILLCLYPIIAILLFCTRFLYQSPFLFMGINTLFHALTGSTQPLELGLYMDNVLYTKYKTGKNMNSLIMSFSNITVRLASVLKSVLIPLTLSLSGYTVGSTTTSIKSSIVNAYSIIPSIFPIIGVILLLFFYKLDKQKMEHINKVLNK